MTENGSGKQPRVSSVFRFLLSLALPWLPHSATLEDDIIRVAGGDNALGTLRGSLSRGQRLRLLHLLRE